MTRFLLDSGIANDYLHRRHGVFERARAELAKGNSIGIGTPVLGELLSGIDRSASRERNLKRLKTNLAAWKLWSFDHMAAVEYGRIHAELVRKGRPMQTVDVMIAAIALSLGNCEIVTTDADLAAVDGLGTDNWRSTTV
jgi:tRNA(fMet)-specific endonuclease VapC